MDPVADLVVADLLYPDHVTENSMVYHRAGHKWYYLSNHNTDEVIIFKQMDSQEGSVPGKSFSHWHGLINNIRSLVGTWLLTRAFSPVA